MRPLQLASLSALALTLAAPLTARAEPVPPAEGTPAVEISCTINAVDKSGTQTVSRPKITTLEGRPATVSVRVGADDGQPGHELVLELTAGPEGVAGEARVKIGDQPPVSHAIHIFHDGQWQELNVIGSFNYLVDCSSRRVEVAKPAPVRPTP